MNLTEPIWRNGAAFPDRPALIADGESLSYGRLERRVRAVAARLSAHGVGRADVVAVGLQQPARSIVTLLALFRIGAVATPYHPATPEPQRFELARMFGVRFLVRAERSAWPGAETLGIRQIRGTELFERGARAFDAATPVAPLAHDVDDAPCYIAVSSGTTGVPKGVPITHRRCALHLATPSWLGNPDRSRVFVATDPTLLLALREWLRCLWSGSTVIVSAHARPAGFFEVLRRDRPTRVVTTTGIATGVVAHARTERLRAAEFASLRSIQLAGSVVSPALRASVGRHLCAHLEVDYGATEIGSMAGLDPEAWAIAPRAHGRIHPWIDVEVVDDDDQPVPAGSPGILRMRGPAMAERYEGDAAATARAFRGGWYYPGDLGTVDAAGFVTIAGRTDNRLNLDGVKVSAESIEAALDAQPGVLESAVTLLPPSGGGKPELVAAIVAGEGFDEAGAREGSRRLLGAQPLPRRIVTVESLPRNAGGKIRRAELPALIAARLAGGAR